MFVELVYGILTNSLGLISDSAHMFFDCSALVLSLLASYFASFPPSDRFSYGYGRVEVVSGLTNCVFLVFVAFSITMESVERIVNPEVIHSDKLLVVAVLGLLVNLVGIAFFHTHEHHHHHHEKPAAATIATHDETNLNHSDLIILESKSEVSVSESNGPANGSNGSSSISDTESPPTSDAAVPVSATVTEQRQNSYVVLEMDPPLHSEHENENLSGVLLHIIADALGSVGVIISALLIKYFNLVLADAICSLIISALILASIVPLLKSTLSMLLLYSPAKLQEKLESVATEILSLSEISDCTNIRLWRYRKEEIVADVKIEIDQGCNHNAIIKKLRKIMKAKKIKRCTIQLDTIRTQEK